jgi:hypothetical protein
MNGVSKLLPWREKKPKVGSSTGKVNHILPFPPPGNKHYR